MEPGVAEGILALRAGRAAVDLSGWRRVRVRGSDAESFLGDLVTGPVAGLEPGGATRSLLLTPTGRIRADLTVARLGEEFLLVQASDQPEPVDRLLAPYVLSSDVELAGDSEDEGPLVAVVPDVPLPAATESYRPGALALGADVLGLPAQAAANAAGVPLVGAAALESWRILEGRPRFPVDLGPDSLPHEADLEAAIDFTKGCYLGQEAVARVRNLGHPPFVVVAVRAGEAVRPGDEVVAGARSAGTVTSGAEDPDGGYGAIVRVRWDAREEELRTSSGVELGRS
jgi:folate-binding protein YgfZ